MELTLSAPVGPVEPAPVECPQCDGTGVVRYWERLAVESQHKTDIAKNMAAWDANLRQLMQDREKHRASIAQLELMMAESLKRWEEADKSLGIAIEAEIDQCGNVDCPECNGERVV